MGTTGTEGLRFKLLFTVAAALITALIGLVIGPHMLDYVGRALGITPRLSFHVETDPSVILEGAPNWWGTSLVGDFDLQDLSAPPGLCRDWHAWGEQYAARPHAQPIRVEVFGQPDTALIRRISIEHIRNTPPPSELLDVTCRVGGADILYSDSRILMEEDGSYVTSYFDEYGEELERLSVGVAAGEVGILDIDVRAQCNCEWVVWLHYTIDGEARTFRIDDNGAPFRSLYRERTKAYEWTQGQWERSESLNGGNSQSFAEEDQVGSEETSAHGPRFSDLSCPTVTLEEAFHRARELEYPWQGDRPACHEGLAVMFMTESIPSDIRNPGFGHAFFTSTEGVWSYVTMLRAPDAEDLVDEGFTRQEAQALMALKRP